MSRSDWVWFTKSLMRIEQLEGTENYYDTTFLFLNEIIAVDSCAIFKISKDKTSGAHHIHTFGFLAPMLAQKLADQYVTKGFRRDPIISSSSSLNTPRTRPAPVIRYSKSYQKDFFEKAGLIDKVSTLYAARTELFVFNFYRKQGKNLFGDVDIQNLQLLAPFICRSVIRHVNLTLFNEADHISFAKLIAQQTINEASSIFSNLSEREKQVAIHMCNGVPETEISRAERISINTVKTYRNRIYSKLGIGNRTELMYLIISSIC